MEDNSNAPGRSQVAGRLVGNESLLEPWPDTGRIVRNKPRLTIYLKADKGKASRPNLDRIPYNHPKIPGKELARRKTMTDSKKYGCAKCNYFWHCCKEGTLAAGKLWTPLIKMTDISGH